MKSIESFILQTFSNEPDLQRFFLVKTKATRVGKDFQISVIVDFDGGVTIDICTEISRILNPLLEAHLGETQYYTLDVMSEGIDSPLESYRQFKKNIGRTLKVITKDKNQLEGILKLADESQITLEISTKVKTKIIDKNNTQELVIKIAEIEKAKVIVIFN